MGTYGTGEGEEFYSSFATGSGRPFLCGFRSGVVRQEGNAGPQVLVRGPENPAR